MIPSWVNDYIGIPFDHGGRLKEQALDCWGLVRAVYGDLYDIKLPAFEGVYYSDDPSTMGMEEVEKYITHERKARLERGAFHEVSLMEAKEGDIIVILVYGRPLHIGIVLEGGLMLSTRQGVDASVESYKSPMWKPRIDAIYRHESL